MRLDFTYLDCDIGTIRRFIELYKNTPETKFSLIAIPPDKSCEPNKIIEDTKEPPCAV